MTWESLWLAGAAVIFAAAAWVFLGLRVRRHFTKEHP